MIRIARGLGFFECKPKLSSHNLLMPFAFFVQSANTLNKKAMIKITATAAAMLLLVASRLVLASATTVGAGEVRRLGGPVQGDEDNFLVSNPRRRQLVQVS